MFLIWFDNDRKRPLQAKVQAAVKRYEERFGAVPELVLLNPAQASAEDTIVGIPVRTTPLVSRDHFYVGAADAAERETLNPAA